MSYNWLVVMCLAGISMLATADTSAPNPIFTGGYMPNGSGLNPVAIIPPPPAAGSAAESRDLEAMHASLSLQGTPRFKLATADVGLLSPKSLWGFSCAAGLDISPETTPKTVALMRKLGPDIHILALQAKKYFGRKRPYMLNGQPTCTPNDEDRLSKDGAYPSAHSALGYGWGLVLAELLPARAAQIIARGRSFGDSRVVCNVHWLSDVEEGRTLASATIARLHAELAFRDDISAAREELAHGVPHSSDCSAEFSILGQ